MNDEPSSESGHVHFPESDISHHEAEILVHELKKDHYNVRLGFLQDYHTYKVTFNFEHNLGKVIETEMKSKKNPCIKILSTSPIDDGHQFVLELRTHEETILQEIIYISEKHNPKSKISLQISAKVLGKGKGTPVLKEGIRTLHTHQRDEDDESDPN
ncbi:UPF0687 protein C20orf27 homolog isoform X2 [Argonauta hians]